MNRVPKIWWLLIIISGGLISGFYFFATSVTVEYEIILNEDGYHPHLLTINKGDKVRFITSRSEPFWPASNDHPIHTIYTDFDPKRPLKPNEAWSFVFTKSGQWDYHDHLYPIFDGTIIVR